MGKRTNTILQSAFFALANIMPIDKAVEYMKYMAKKSYLKKGEAVVEMNYKAIDAGLDALVKINVPASWKTIETAAKASAVTGTRPDLVRFVKDIVIPVAKMDGDSLPVSAFTEYVDGTYPQGAAAYEKRGVAVDVPEWIPENCIQCNQCAFVCPHATIRPYALSESEKAAAPASLKSVKMNGKGCDQYSFTMAVSPLDCMGCTLCVSACPAKEKALVMKSQESQADQAAAWNYCVNDVSVKDLPFAGNTLKGSQFKQPLLEFSGSCAGCAETSYARIITQLFGERMYISNATGCSSIWGGSAPATPYTVNRDSGRGPAWANSLFEDNAEHGLGIYLGQKTIRNRLIEKVKELNPETDDDKAVIDAYLSTVDDGEKNVKATEALVALLEKWAANGCGKSAEILSEKSYLSKKSVWIFGGDGWAYDIGFGGLDHVIASGEDVNIMIFDTEVYSNTGGQASKASQLGQVAQFAAAGKAIGKKNLAAIAMSYGYVYVAQIAMGADKNQTMKALLEAEAYHGPSVIIGYAPCEMHGLKGGMANCQNEMKRAVDAGYWQMFRYNPLLKAEGKNPFILDSKAPTADYIEFINSETRYSRLVQSFPERAKELFEEAKAQAEAKYEAYKELAAQD